MKNKPTKAFIQSSAILTVTGGLFALALSSDLFHFDTEEHFSHQHTPESMEVRKLSEKAYQQFDHAHPHHAEHEEEALPHSLQGAEYHFHAKTDEEGNLLVDSDIRELFDFYLAAIDEEKLDKILLRINHALSEQLSDANLQHAQSILKKYIEYKISLIELNQSFSTDSTTEVSILKLQQEYVQQLRRDLLGTNVAEAFFQHDEAYADYMLSRMEVTQNQTLSEQERKLALAEAELNLPEEMRQVRKKVSQHAELSDKIKTMRLKGASDSDIFEARSETLGNHAAGKLAKLDQRRAEWKQRLADYAAARNEIKASGLSDQDQLLALNDLVDRRFQGREKIRVRALDSEL